MFFQFFFRSAQQKKYDSMIFFNFVQVTCKNSFLWDRAKWQNREIKQGFDKGFSRKSQQLLFAKNKKMKNWEIRYTRKFVQIRQLLSQSSISTET